MNIPPSIITDTQFKILLSKVGPCAAHVLIAIGIKMQQRKTRNIYIPNPEFLLMEAEADGMVDAQRLWDALIGHWLFPDQDAPDSYYRFEFFEDHNKVMFGNWKGGETTRARYAGKPRAIQSNSTQVNPSQINSTQSKSIQVNSSQFNSGAMAHPPTSHGSPMAHPSPEDDQPF